MKKFVPPLTKMERDLIVESLGNYASLLHQLADTETNERQSHDLSLTRAAVETLAARLKEQPVV